MQGGDVPRSRLSAAAGRRASRLGSYARRILVRLRGYMRLSTEERCGHRQRAGCTSQLPAILALAASGLTGT